MYFKHILLLTVHHDNSNNNITIMKIEDDKYSDNELEIISIVETIKLNQYKISVCI